jgi:hypothetical protein
VIAERSVRPRPLFWALSAPLPHLVGGRRGNDHRGTEIQQRAAESLSARPPFEPQAEALSTQRQCPADEDSSEQGVRLAHRQLSNRRLYVIVMDAWKKTCAS